MKRTKTLLILLLLKLVKKFFFKISYQFTLKQVTFTTKTWRQTNLSTISLNNSMTKQNNLSMRHPALMIPFQITLKSFLMTSILAPSIDLICQLIKMLSTCFTRLLKPPTTDQLTQRPLTTYPSIHRPLTHRPTNGLSSIYVKIETRF